MQLSKPLLITAVFAICASVASAKTCGNSTVIIPDCKCPAGQGLKPVTGVNGLDGVCEKCPDRYYSAAMDDSPCTLAKTTEVVNANKDGVTECLAPFVVKDNVCDCPAPLTKIGTGTGTVCDCAHNVAKVVNAQNNATCPLLTDITKSEQCQPNFYLDANKQCVGCAAGEVRAVGVAACAKPKHACETTTTERKGTTDECKCKGGFHQKVENNVTLAVSEASCIADVVETKKDDKPSSGMMNAPLVAVFGAAAVAAFFL